MSRGFRLVRWVAVGGVLLVPLAGVLAGPVAALAVSVCVVVAASAQDRRGQVAEDRLEALTREVDDAVRHLQQHGVDGVEAVGPRIGRPLAAILSGLPRPDALERVEQEAGRFRRAMDAAPAGVMITGPDGRVLYVNRAFCTFMEVRRHAIGLWPREVMEVPEVQESLELARERGAASDDLLAVSGERDLSIQAAPLAGGMLVVVRDLTQFRAAQRSRTDFIANVSHELRTPTAAVLGFSELLMASLDDPELRGMADTIHRNALRLRDLFDDLLELHRIEAQRGEMPRVWVALEPILRRAAQPAMDRATGKSQSFEVSCEEGVEVCVNAEALTTMLANLISNASKYTPVGGHVAVRVHAGREGVRIDVEDDGVGIPEDQQTRVFERFYRVADPRHRSEPGTGIGLAIVKHLGMAAGVEVTLRSTPGVGSVFSLHLPSGADVASPAADGSEPPAATI